MSPAEAAQFVTSHRDTIDRVVAIFAKYYALSADEAGRLADGLDATLAADDYRVTRSYRGACTPASFFAVVLVSLAPRRECTLQGWSSAWCDFATSADWWPPHSSRRPPIR